MIDVVLAASVAGLAASAHCAAMCGPVAVAGTCPRGVLDRREAAKYLGARLLGYATLGALLGASGEGALRLLPVGLLQTAASLAVAALAIARAIMALRPVAVVVPGSRLARGPWGQATGRSLLSVVLSFLPRRAASLGAATALFPCGALVPAWILAAGTAEAHTGALTMAAFALASAPGLIAAATSAQAAGRLLGRVPRRVQAAAWLVLAAWMLARPLLGTSCCAI